MAFEIPDDLAEKALRRKSRHHAGVRPAAGGGEPVPAELHAAPSGLPTIITLADPIQASAFPISLFRISTAL